MALSARRGPITLPSTGAPLRSMVLISTPALYRRNVKLKAKV
jgi:hypothetical protein